MHADALCVAVSLCRVTVSDLADAMRRKAPPAVSDPCVVVVAVEHKHRADTAVEPLAAAGELADAVQEAATCQRQRSHQHRSLQAHARVVVIKHAAHAGDVAPRGIRMAAAAVGHHAVASRLQHVLQRVADWVVVFHREQINGVNPAEICIRCHPALIPAVQLTAAG